MKAQLGWTFSAAASPASLSASPGSVEARVTNDGSGQSSRGSSRRSIRRSCSSKTCLGSGRLDCEMCWPTLPGSGSMRSGTISGRPRRVLRIDDDACFFLPTPTASSGGYNVGGGSGRVGKERPSLATMARRGLLPTPLASAGQRGGRHVDARGREGGPSLSAICHRGLLATPTVAGNYNRAGASDSSGDGLATQMGGALNPRFLEWMMGLPDDWTASAYAATPSSRNKRRSRSKRY